MIAALAATAAYGALQGIVITRLRLPSFVVTLAGYLGLSGLLLFLIASAGKYGLGGVINLNSNVINDIENGSLNATASWIVMIALVVVAGFDAVPEGPAPAGQRPRGPAAEHHAAQGRRSSRSPAWSWCWWPTPIAGSA